MKPKILLVLLLTVSATAPGWAQRASTPTAGAAPTSATTSAPACGSEEGSLVRSVPGTDVPGWVLSSLRDSPCVWGSVPGTDVPGYVLWRPCGTDGKYDLRFSIYDLRFQNRDSSLRKAELGMTSTG